MDASDWPRIPGTFWGPTWAYWIRSRNSWTQKRGLPFYGWSTKSILNPHTPSPSRIPAMFFHPHPLSSIARVGHANPWHWTLYTALLSASGEVLSFDAQTTPQSTQNSLNIQWSQALFIFQEPSGCKECTTCLHRFRHDRIERLGFWIHLTVLLMNVCELRVSKVPLSCHHLVETVQYVRRCVRHTPVITLPANKEKATAVVSEDFY